MAVFDCTTDDGLDDGVEAATEAVRDGHVVVLPTDTVYGVGCDAFSADAVTLVLDAKGRGRDMPPPVLVPSPRTVDGLAVDVPAWARDLMDEFWPGPLTLVLRSHTSLQWDLGDTNGTVALRMPDDEIALRLLTEVGPMAVTSANRTGSPPATTVTEAATMLGAAVEVYLDGGPRAESAASTIVDCTGEEPVVLREGALAWAEIDVVVQRSLAASPDEAQPTSTVDGDADDQADDQVADEAADTEIDDEADGGGDTADIADTGDDETEESSTYLADEDEPVEEELEIEVGEPEPEAPAATTPDPTAPDAPAPDTTAPDTTEDPQEQPRP